MTLKENNSRFVTKIKYIDEKIILILFIFAVIFQILFALKIDYIKPKYDLMKNAPNKKFVDIAALGDRQFIYRLLAFRMQNSGDVFAGFPPLKYYNYKNLYNWMMLLDKYDSKSNVIVHIASNYYAMNQNKKELIYIIDYIRQHANKDYKNKWLWLVQAIMIAKKDYNDNNLALEIANELADNSTDNMPIWTKQFPAFIYEDMGKSCMAFFVIENIINNYEAKDKTISDFEMQFMKHFISKRLDKLKKEKFDPKKCRKIQNYTKKSLKNP
jgi:hypothetical protein